MGPEQNAMEHTHDQTMSMDCVLGHLHSLLTSHCLIFLSLSHTLSLSRFLCLTHSLIVLCFVSRRLLPLLFLLLFLLLLLLPPLPGLRPSCGLPSIHTCSLFHLSLLSPLSLPIPVPSFTHASHQHWLWPKTVCPHQPSRPRI